MTRKVIVDCDPGHDDALAILLAGRRLEVLAITTVAGNQTVEKVTTTAGMTVCDDRYTRTAPDVPAARRGAPPNAEVAVDADRCFALLLGVLREYP